MITLKQLRADLREIRFYYIEERFVFTIQKRVEDKPKFTPDLFIVIFIAYDTALPFVKFFEKHLAQENF